MSIKNPLTPAGIQLATFRFVAKHLNHCATAVAPEALHKCKNPVPIGEKTSFASEALWTVLEKKKYLTSSEIRTPEGSSRS